MTKFYDDTGRHQATMSWYQIYWFCKTTWVHNIELFLASLILDNYIFMHQVHGTWSHWNKTHAVLHRLLVWEIPSSYLSFSILVRQYLCIESGRQSRRTPEAAGSGPRGSMNCLSFAFEVDLYACHMLPCNVRVTKIIAICSAEIHNLVHVPGSTCLGSPVHWCITALDQPIMTSSNGNIFRVTGHLCGEFTGPHMILWYVWSIFTYKSDYRFHNMSFHRMSPIVCVMISLSLYPFNSS